MVQHAQLTCSSNIAWSGGDLFNGYVLLIAALPSTGGVAWTRLALGDSRPLARVPMRYRVPIRAGQYAADSRVWRTDALVPPSVRYSAFFYDSTDRLIAPGAALFAIAADPYTLAPPVLTDPTAAVVSPTPETVPTAPVVVFQNVPVRENVAGTKNGVNTTFSISRSGSVVFIIWNNMILTAGTHYTLTGTALTMNIPPDAGDVLEAVIYG
jgi:hypothetical protein